MISKWILGLLMLLTTTEASSGDRSIWYGECTQVCVTKYECSKKFGTLDWVRGGCFWCRYNCMWETVEHFESNFGIVPQFHGKWPFLAIPLPFGFVIQEPASVIFSLLNLLTVFVMLRRLKRMNKLQNRRTWLVYAHVGLVTWMFSTIFHTFDCDVTEKMDYFGAFAFVLSGFYVSSIFTLPQLDFTRLGRFSKRIAPFGFILVFLNHLKDMNNHFDYGYNMSFCITLSIATTCLYLYYLYRRRLIYGSLQEADILLIRLIVWANLAAALELLEFVPVFWIFDSHSLFHLATIPIPIWWTEFLRLTYYDSGETSARASLLKIA